MIKSEIVSLKSFLKVRLKLFTLHSNVILQIEICSSELSREVGRKIITYIWYILCPQWAQMLPKFIITMEGGKKRKVFSNQNEVK